jgi:hypothetical protein
MRRSGGALPTHLAALAGYVALAVVVTWPLVTLIGSPRIAGGTGVVFTFQDGSQNVWNLWWARYALAHGYNPFWTPLLYYPDGVQMYLQTLNYVNALLTMPVNLLAGPVAAYQVAVLLGVALTGYGGFLLARHFVPQAPVAFLAGALLTAAPFHILTLQNNQLQLIAMQCLPLYMLALLRLDGLPVAKGLWPIPRAEWAVAGSLAGAAVLVALTDWYWVLICAVFTAVWAATGLLRPGRLILLRRYTLAGLGAALVLSPLLAGLLTVRRDLPSTDTLSDRVWHGYIRGFSADALGLLLPPPFHPVLAPLAPFSRADYGIEGWYVGAGWATLALAAVGLALAWRAQWRLIIAGAVCWVLSLGPTLWLAGRDTGVTMPYAWLQSLPLLGVGRRPALFAVMLIVLAAIFAAVGLASLTERWGRGRTMPLALPLAALALFEAWPPPRVVFTFAAPPAYARIAGDAGAVADLPISFELENARTLRNQMVHGQPILDGYVARWPGKITIYSNPWLRQLATLDLLPVEDIAPLDGPALAVMQCAAPVRHVVLDTALVTAGERRNAETLLARLAGAPLAPVYADTTHVAYTLPLFAEACRPFLALGYGWHKIEGDPGAPWRWSNGRSALVLTNPYAAPRAVALSLGVRSSGAPRRVELWADRGRQLATWEAGIVWRRHQVLLVLPPGVTALELRAPAEHEPPPGGGRMLSVAVRDVAVTPVP